MFSNRSRRLPAFPRSCKAVKSAHLESSASEHLCFLWDIHKSIFPSCRCVLGWSGTIRSRPHGCVCEAMARLLVEVKACLCFIWLSLFVSKAKDKHFWFHSISIQLIRRAFFTWSSFWMRFTCCFSWESVSIWVLKLLKLEMK